MKKLILICLLLAGAPKVYAQVPGLTQIRPVTSNPSGACTNGSALQYNYSAGSGKLWGCLNSVWTEIVSPSGVSGSLSYYGPFSGRPAASTVVSGLAIINDCADNTCAAGGGTISKVHVDIGSSWLVSDLTTVEEHYLKDSSSGNVKFYFTSSDAQSYQQMASGTYLVWMTCAALTGGGCSVQSAIVNNSGEFDFTNGSSGFVPIKAASCVAGCYALKGTSAIDFGAVADGSWASSTFTLSGAATSDHVEPLIPAGLDEGVDVKISVSAANTIKVTIFNNTGASYNPSSLTFGALISR